MKNKKYYTISEVSELLGVAIHNLRALDKVIGRKLLRIKGRRYYLAKDIELLRVKMMPAAATPHVIKEAVQLPLPFLEMMHVKSVKKERVRPINSIRVPEPAIAKPLFTLSNKDEFLKRLDNLILSFQNLHNSLQSH